MSRIINKLNINQILNRVGTIIQSQKNEKIAKELAVAPQTCSNWKTRKAIPWVELFEFAIKHDIQLDWLFLGKEKSPAKHQEDVNIKKKDQPKHSDETKQLKEKLELKEEMLKLTRENAELLRNENTRLKNKIKNMKKNCLAGRRQNDPSDLDTAKLRKKAM